MKRLKILFLFAGVMLILSLSASLSLAQDETARPEGWDAYSHGNETEPDYAVVLPDDAVNTITITISPQNWQAMQDDMTNLYGEFGRQQNRGAVGGEGGQPPFRGVEPPEGVNPAQIPPPDGEDGQPPNPGMNVISSIPNPMWVNVDIAFEGQVWTNVGMRYKGNASLGGTWGQGSLKLPFRLDFDEFEDDYPEIDNQRFYGFQKLSFSNNYRDESYLHERVAADVFRAAGIPAAQTAFYAVYVDYGEGAIYLGLYTAVEMIDDTVLDTQFSSDEGNLYKPEGEGATFASGTFDEVFFEKDTNEDEADFSDILALFDALHAESRTTDPEAWRADLEAVLDVDGFIHWLAVNRVIQNWDTYGTMSHNYYLYNDPATGLLTWIPWDNNEALTTGGLGREGQNGNISLDLTGTDDSWPLISYLMNDPVYHDMYVNYAEDTINGAFNPAAMTVTYQALHELITPYVVGSDIAPPDPRLTSPEAFENSLVVLINHVNERYVLTQEYVSAQTAD